MEQNKIIEAVQGISAGTIARTVCLFIALANQIMVMCGITPIQLDDNTVYEFVSVLFTVVTALVAWWKNNSFTVQAREADVYKKELKK